MVTAPRILVEINFEGWTMLVLSDPDKTTAKEYFNRIYGSVALTKDVLGNALR